MRAVAPSIGERVEVASGIYARNVQGTEIHVRRIEGAQAELETCETDVNTWIVLHHNKPLNEGVFRDHRRLQGARL